MSWVNIPLTADPWSEFQVTLDEKTYVLRLRWNTRASAWFMDVLDADLNMLRAGCKVVVGSGLTGATQTDPDMPPGVFFAVDTSGEDIDPTIDDLGTRVLLYYVEEGTF